MACDAVTGPLVQSGWLNPFCALGTNTLEVAYNKRFLPAAFPWLMGRAASPHPLLLRARMQTFTLSSECWGPLALLEPVPGCGAGTAPGKGLRAGETGCSQWVSAAHPGAHSLVMLAYTLCFSRGMDRHLENCHTPAREVTKSQHSRGTYPGAVLAEANPSGTEQPHFLQPHFLQLSLYPPLALRGCKSPALRVFLVFLQVLLQITLQAIQPSCHLSARSRVTSWAE